jgi:hypothetical protein
MADGPIVMRLPLDDPTVDRITKYRLEKSNRRWRWELSDQDLARTIAELTQEAMQAVVDARSLVFAKERELVVSVLNHIEAVGKLIQEDREEQ